MSAQLKEIDRLDLALRQANQRLDAAEKEAAVANGKATEYVPCRTLFCLFVCLFACFLFVCLFVLFCLFVCLFVCAKKRFCSCPSAFHAALLLSLSNPRVLSLLSPVGVDIGC
jgi:hypothetical protein